MFDSESDLQLWFQRKGARIFGSLAGEEAGSKLEKAQALGVAVIDEAEFLRLVGGS